mgnify:CR=1 FL=1
MLSEEQVKEKIAALRADLEGINGTYAEKLGGINAAQEQIRVLQQEAILLEKQAISINGSIAALESVLPPESLLTEETTEETANT